MLFILKRNRFADPSIFQTVTSSIYMTPNNSDYFLGIQQFGAQSEMNSKHATYFCELLMDALNIKQAGLFEEHCGYASE